MVSGSRQVAAIPHKPVVKRRLRHDGVHGVVGEGTAGRDGKLCGGKHMIRGVPEEVRVVLSQCRGAREDNRSRCKRRWSGGTNGANTTTTTAAIRRRNRCQACNRLSNNPGCRGVVTHLVQDRDDCHVSGHVAGARVVHGGVDYKSAGRVYGGRRTGRVNHEGIRLTRYRDLPVAVTDDCPTRPGRATRNGCLGREGDYGGNTVGNRGARSNSHPTEGNGKCFRAPAGVCRYLTILAGQDDSNSPPGHKEVGG